MAKQVGASPATSDNYATHKHKNVLAWLAEQSFNDETQH